MKINCIGLGLLLVSSVVAQPPSQPLSNQPPTAGSIADYTEAIRLHPNDAKPYIDRGLAKEKQGDLAGAIADDSEAIRLDPTNAMAYFNRGLSKANQGDQAGAIADYSEAIGLKPDYWNAFYNRGYAKANQRRSGRGHRRLLRGYPPRSRECNRIQHPRLGKIKPKATRPGPSRIAPRLSASIRKVQSHTATEARQN